MAATLEAIASDALGFYNANEQLAQDVVMDVRDSGLCISWDILDGGEGRQTVFYFPTT